MKPSRDMKPNLACREFESLLGTWMDGALDSPAARRVEGHVASCPACSAEAEAWREISARIRAAAAEVPPPRWDAIERRIEAARRESVLVLRSLKRVAAAAAAILVLSLGLLALEPWRGGSAGSESEGLHTEDALEVVLSVPAWGGDH